MARALLSLAAVTAVSLVSAFSTDVYPPKPDEFYSSVPENKTSSSDNIVGGPLPIPFPLSDFTITAGLTQNTYCYDENNTPGVKVDDNTDLWSLGADSFADRITIYHSPSLGIVMAYMGTNASNSASEFENSQLELIPSDPAVGLPLGALVLKGFNDLFVSSWEPYVKPALYQVKGSYPDLPIFMTGHSQGSGTAQLTAMAIAKEFGPDSISKVITYGPPRAGNIFWADAFDAVFNGRYAGVTNGNDWVSDWPPLLSGYEHPSGMVWINPANSTNYQFYPDQEDLNGIDSRIPELIDPTTGTTYWGDHQGIYMHSWIGVYLYGPCPGQIGGY